MCLFVRLLVCSFVCSYRMLHVFEILVWRVCLFVCVGLFVCVFDCLGVVFSIVVCSFVWLFVCAFV